MKDKISELHQQLLSINGGLQKATELLVELEQVNVEEDLIEEPQEEEEQEHQQDDVKQEGGSGSKTADVVLQEKIDKFMDIRRQLAQLKGDNCK